ncbi:MAG: class I SAM-dependent methyltransferase [Chloroflexi bacterium]|nr:class I SAM-dependent methyltransferase [Chloroflexota bacterium]
MLQLQQTIDARAKYGLDAPGLVWTFLCLGIVFSAFGLVLALLINNGNLLLLLLCILALYNGFWMLLSGVLMLRSSFVGKLRMRDQLLDALSLSGNETVLDVGCGHGLLLIGAALRLPRGRAVGVDHWSVVDQGRSNCRTTTLANANAEHVADRVEVRDGDMRDLPFDDASFDAVVASLAIHNISSREERRQAIREIVRVLKPQGKVALLDFRHSKQYAADLRECGMHNIHISKLSFQMYPPVHTVTAIKA